MQTIWVSRIMQKAKMMFEVSNCFKISKSLVLALLSSFFRTEFSTANKENCSQSWSLGTPFSVCQSH